MKNLSKLIIASVSAVAFLLVGGAKAQISTPNKFALSLGIEAGKPTGNASPYAVFNLGGTVRLQYGISNMFAVTLTTGGYHFFMEKIPGTDVSYSSYGVGPVKAGFKAFVIPNAYIGFEAGEGVEVTEHGFSGGQKKLLLSPAVGYAEKHWDFALHYESLTGDQNNYGIVALRIAYGFQL
jgi:hypothetical protein